MMQISHFLISNLNSDEQRKLYSAEPSYLGIHKTHTCTHFKRVPVPHSHLVLQLYLPLQITLFPPHRTNPQAVTLPKTTSTCKPQLFFKEGKGSEFFMFMYLTFNVCKTDTTLIRFLFFFLHGFLTVFESFSCMILHSTEVTHGNEQVMP